MTSPEPLQYPVYETAAQPAESRSPRSREERWTCCCGDAVQLARMDVRVRHLLGWRLTAIGQGFWSHQQGAESALLFTASFACGMPEVCHAYELRLVSPRRGRAALKAVSLWITSPFTGGSSGSPPSSSRRRAPAVTLRRPVLHRRDLREGRYRRPRPPPDPRSIRPAGSDHLTQPVVLISALGHAHRSANATLPPAALAARLGLEIGVDAAGGGYCRPPPKRCLLARIGAALRISWVERYVLRGGRAGHRAAAISAPGAVSFVVHRLRCIT